MRRASDYCADTHLEVIWQPACHRDFCDGTEKQANRDESEGPIAGNLLRRDTRNCSWGALGDRPRQKSKYCRGTVEQHHTSEDGEERPPSDACLEGYEDKQQNQDYTNIPARMLDTGNTDPVLSVKVTQVQSSALTSYRAQSP